MINPNTGYMFILLEKELYQPGAMVKGSIFFELFHHSLQNKLMVKFEGLEYVPKKYQRQIYEQEGSSDQNDASDNSAI